MQNALDPEMPLPPIREDLQLIKGGNELSGAPTWVIYDPLRHRYFQIDKQSVRLLKLWPNRNVRQLLEENNLGADGEETIKSLISFLFANSLTVDPPSGGSESLVKQMEAGKKSVITTLLHNYLFFRLPLVRPHGFLSATGFIVEIFFRPIWWVFVGIVFFLGSYLAIRQWDAFANTFEHFFDARGLTYYVLALAAVKVTHELGHAYATTRFGGRVSVIGVAFLVMFPVLYTDTTDSWRMREHRKRLVIDGAGVAAELTVAIFSTFAWALLPEGPMRSVAFFLAASSWTISLAVNLNPLMRFDGYHLLADALGVQNLQARSFALGRWWLRELIFRFSKPPSEAVSTGMRRLLISYAFACWIYRFFLFLGIGLLIHELFPKPFGTMLFVIEMLFFIVKPVADEIREWGHQFRSRKRSPRSIAGAAVFGAVLLASFLPFPSTIRVPAIIEADSVEVIHALKPAQVTDIKKRIGESVKAGEMVVALTAPAAEIEQDLALKKLDLVNLKLSRIASDPRSRDQRLVYLKERQQLKRQLDRATLELARLSVKTSLDGTVRELMPNLHVGRWVNGAIPAAVMREGENLHGRGYVKGDQAAHVGIGTSAVFIPDALEMPKILCVVASVEPSHAETVATQTLDSRYGGPIAVAENGKPIESWYPITLHFDESNFDAGYQIRGEVHISGPWRSVVDRLWRRILIVGVRETSF